MRGFGRMGNARHSIAEPSLRNVPVHSCLTCIPLCVSDALRLPLTFSVCRPLRLLTPPQFSFCVAQRLSGVSAMDFCLFLKGKPIRTVAKTILTIFIRRGQTYPLPRIFSQTLGISWTRDVVFGFNGPLYISSPLICQLLPDTMWTFNAHNILWQGAPRSYLLCEVLPSLGYFGF